MPIYIVSGRCNCPRLARCELAAGRLMLRYPNVYVEFDMHDPEEYHSHVEGIKRKYKFNDEEWQKTDKGLVVYTREGQLVGDDVSFFNMLASKYKLSREEPDIPDEDMSVLVSELAKVNEEQFRKAVLEKKNGPGILAEVARRSLELLFALHPPRVAQDAAETVAENTAGAVTTAVDTPAGVSTASNSATQRSSTAAAAGASEQAAISSPAGSSGRVKASNACSRLDIESAPAGQAAGIPAGANGPEAFFSGKTEGGSQAKTLQRVDLVPDHKESVLFGLYAPQHVRVTRAIQNGLAFLVWGVAGLRQRNQANMALKTGFQYMADAFVLDSMLPRKEAFVKRTHHVVLADEPITQKHFFLVPKKYLVTVTDHKVLDCLKTPKKICCFYSENEAQKLAPAVARLAELLDVAVITECPEKFKPSRARTICVKLSDLQSRDRLRFPLSAVSRCGYILDNVTTSVPVCRAFVELVSAPDVCITLRSSDEQREDEVDKMKVFFHCRKLTFSVREDEDIDQFATAAAAEVSECFSTSQQSRKMSFYVRDKFYRLHRRLVREVFRGLLPDDWEALKNILDQNNVVAAFQFLPERWPDHRRPIDTHIHILPLPLHLNHEDQVKEKVVNFLFERQIEVALQHQSPYLRDLDLLHVLVPVIQEDGSSGDTERNQRPRNEYEIAFWKAHRLLQADFSPHFNLNLTGFSLLVSQRFLLLIPHNAPQLEENFCCDVLTHAIWHKWPVPHPIAYLGGPIITPIFKKQWTPHDDKSPRGRPIVYAAAVDEDPDEIDFSKYGGRSHSVKNKFAQRVCVHEEAHNRPLDILKLFCLRRRTKIQEEKDN